MTSHHAILHLLQTYFEGLFTGDVSRLREVFHPQAMLFGEVKGTPYLRKLDEYLDAVGKRQSPQSLGEPFAMAVLAIDVQGPVAMARVSCPMLGFRYIDFLSLTQQNGHWQIASKTFTHVALPTDTES
ncbi:nuclear transport factor 2 family protein [Leeia sp.]|uniref:nuclear transport factor 2 family protein n=1 Tax=Leeia sp. TaxID=2884678 RepID=UPI0035B2B9D9